VADGRELSVRVRTTGRRRSPARPIQPQLNFGGHRTRDDLRFCAPGRTRTCALLRRRIPVVTASAQVRGHISAAPLAHMARTRRGQQGDREVVAFDVVPEPVQVGVRLAIAAPDIE